MTEARAHKMREYNTSPFARVENSSAFNRQFQPTPKLEPRIENKVSNTFASSVFEGMNYPN